jgi:hypothetical protein
MKKDNHNNPQKNSTDNKVLTRKQALKKVGLTTLTTASMLFLMKSQASAAGSSPTPPPTW